MLKNLVCLLEAYNGDSKLIAKAFFFSEKLDFENPTTVKVLRNFCKFYAIIFLYETQWTGSEKAQVLWINETNYSAFLIEVDFDEIFE